MKSRLIVAALLVPVLLVVMFLAPPIYFAIIIAAVTAIGAYELLNATKFNKSKGTTGCAIVSAAAIPIAACFDVDLTLLIVYCLLVALFCQAIYRYQTKKPISFLCIVMVVFAGAIIPASLTTLVKFRVISKYYALIPFIIAFLSDAGAYFVGIAIGKRKLIAKISPKKTVEGSIGGFVFAIISMIVYGIILSFFDIDYNYPVAILYAVLGSAVSQLGDLAFSLIKREYEIKDFGNVLAEHGGILDRFDGVIFVAPLVFVLIQWLPVF